MIPSSVAQFRAHYRGSQIPKVYTGVGHCLVTAGVTLGAATYCVIRIHQWNSSTLVTVFAILILGNFFEYILHRYPLHHPFPLIRKVFQIHTLEHHHFFTFDAMEFETPLDFWMVLFPYWAPFLNCIGTGLIAYFIVRPLISFDTALIVAACANLYFLMYEACHFYDHLPDQLKITKIPGLRDLRSHHKIHHDLGLMTRYNFNVTLPIFDYIFSTKFSPNQASVKNLNTNRAK